jgi:hypothetical protein
MKQFFSPQRCIVVIHIQLTKIERFTSPGSRVQKVNLFSSRGIFDSKQDNDYKKNSTHISMKKRIALYVQVGSRVPDSQRLRFSPSPIELRRQRRRSDVLDHFLINILVQIFQYYILISGFRCIGICLS